MSDLDSWEEIEQPPPTNMAAPTSSKLNPNAQAFTFNPSAPSFSPSVYSAPVIQAPVYTPPTMIPPQSMMGAPVVGFIPAAGSAPAQASVAPSVPAAVSASVSPPVAEPINFEPDGADINEKFVEDKQTENPDSKAESSVPPVIGLDGNDGYADADEGSTKEPENDVELAASALQDLNIDSYTDDPSDDSAEPSCKELIEEPDELKHLNVVFIGHVDAGKSTIGGQILFISNMVDERTIQKYEREAKEKNRESWYMAYIMDTNEEERAKGKTVEVGRAHFETLKSRFTILDAPGHKNYVPNMISGASQADVGVLVIAARKGEFETGFERGGQTREHAQLAKTLGVSKLLVVVNKMDDPSVQWSKERFDEIEKKMVPFLKSCGYNVKKDVQFLPISGLYGHNMKERISKDICPWWDGPCLFEALDAVEIPERNPTGPFRMPLIDKYKDMGTVVMGKIESGSVRRGDGLIVMPNKAPVKVVTIFRDTREVNYAKPGENLRIRLSGVEEEDISPGFVLSSLRNPISAVLEFDAQLQILELLDHKAIFTAGYKAILHIHAVVEECEIMQLLQQIDPKTKKPIKKRVLFVKTGAVVVARIQVTQQICVEKFEDFPQLGRFTLRDEGKTVAIGKVVKLPKVATIQE